MKYLFRRSSDAPNPIVIRSRRRRRSWNELLVMLAIKMTCLVNAQKQENSWNWHSPENHSERRVFILNLIAIRSGIRIWGWNSWCLPWKLKQAMNVLTINASVLQLELTWPSKRIKKAKMRSSLKVEASYERSCFAIGVSLGCYPKEAPTPKFGGVAL